MAGRLKRSRRLWDTYSFPGFRPEQTVRGVFGDPKARVITLKRRSKKPRAAAAVASRWAGTIARCAGCAICRAATRGWAPRTMTIFSLDRPPVRRDGDFRFNLS